MRKHFARRFCLLAVGCLLLLSCRCSGLSSTTTVKGYVRTGEGRPIAGAEVRLGGLGNEAKTTSQADGFYTITVSHRPAQVIKLTVSKPGYATHKQEFPGFAAPKGDNNVELMETVSYPPSQ